ncbi:uncharacterized protein At1g43920, Chloroplastic-like [Vigna unguiculata]|uniref:uncharacterized protein At1g43920, Chloroplastic-like n=1 Tax=Vigna unguiculata TaxID=3917 RepID=UPI0010166FBB|nr:uncharacterized protein At1g43920, Chloroplastic-like [Vigna unguiculata]XP_027926154.1 uncharacterized protein At1g43920, Chloroplastic-like [Vigna unguiculata]
MKRSGGSKSVPSSSSASAHVGSSQFGRKVCGCGDQLLLLKATTAKNNGRFFFRCRNWASESNCNYFRWADAMEAELEGKREIEEGENENLSYSDTMILQLVQKNAKLKKKLLAERKLGEIKLFFFILSWAFTVILCVLFLLKSNCKD